MQFDTVKLYCCWRCCFYCFCYWFIFASCIATISNYNKLDTVAMQEVTINQQQTQQQHKQQQYHLILSNDIVVVVVVAPATFIANGLFLLLLFLRIKLDTVAMQEPMAAQTTISFDIVVVVAAAASVFLLLDYCCFLHCYRIKFDTVAIIKYKAAAAATTTITFDTINSVKRSDVNRCKQGYIRTSPILHCISHLGKNKGGRGHWASQNTHQNTDFSELSRKNRKYCV